MKIILSRFLYYVIYFIATFFIGQFILNLLQLDLKEGLPHVALMSFILLYLISFGITQLNFWKNFLFCFVIWFLAYFVDVFIQILAFAKIISFKILTPGQLTLVFFYIPIMIFIELFLFINNRGKQK